MKVKNNNLFFTKTFSFFLPKVEFLYQLQTRKLRHSDPWPAIGPTSQMTSEPEHLNA